MTFAAAARVLASAVNCTVVAGTSAACSEFITPASDAAAVDKVG